MKSFLYSANNWNSVTSCKYENYFFDTNALIWVVSVCQ